MGRLVKAFTQAAKDTVNGFNLTSVWGCFHAGITGWNAYQFGVVATYAGMTSSLAMPGLFVAAGLYFAHQSGRERRLSGEAPRYIP